MTFPGDKTRTGIPGATGLRFCRAEHGDESHWIEVWTGEAWVEVIPEDMDEAFKAGAHEAIMAALCNAYGDAPVFPPEDAGHVIVNRTERKSDDMAWEAADHHRAALKERVDELEGEQRAALSLIRKMAKEVHKPGVCESPLGFGPCDICRMLRTGDRDLMRAFEWWSRDAALLDPRRMA